MQKAEKVEAGYGANPLGFSCGVCRHFRKPHGCAIVHGNINAEDCCNLFTSRTYKPALPVKKSLKDVC